MVEGKQRPQFPDPDLLPAEVREQLPPLYSCEEQGMDALALVKLFTPDAGWCWYLQEFDGEDLCYGLVVGLEIEFGYTSVAELQSARGPMGLPIERDEDFEPTPVGQLLEQHRRERGY